MLICLDLNSATPGETNAYIAGYNTARSNYNDIIIALSEQISNLQRLNSEIHLSYSNEINEREKYHTNMMLAMSNWSAVNIKLTEAKEKKKANIQSVIFFGLGLGSKILYDWGRENVQISVPLIRIGN